MMNMAITDPQAALNFLKLCSDGKSLVADPRLGNLKYIEVTKAVPAAKCEQLVADLKKTEIKIMSNINIDGVNHTTAISGFPGTLIKTTDQSSGNLQYYLEINDNVVDLQFRAILLHKIIKRTMLGV